MGTSVEVLRRRRHCENLGASVSNDRNPRILAGRRLCDEALKVFCTAHVFTVEDSHDVTDSHVRLCRKTHRRTSATTAPGPWRQSNYYAGCLRGSPGNRLG